MEPMVTISLKEYNKLLAYNDMVDEMIEESKKEVRSEIIPAFGTVPKRFVYVKVNRNMLKELYSKLLGENKEDMNITLGD